MNSGVSLYIEITETISYKGLTGGWTKWGGRRYGVLTDRQDSTLPDVWVCQSCSKDQPRGVPPYKYEYPEGEYLRVCGICYAKECIDLMLRIHS